MSAIVDFIERGGPENVKDIDKSVKNKFNWSWMDVKDDNNEFLSDFIRKIKEPGMAWCISCRIKINYGSSGKKALIGHSKNTYHVNARKALKETQSLPAVMTATKKLVDCTTDVAKSKPLPYRASESIKTYFQNHKNATASSTCPDKPAKVPVSIADCKSHLEALFCTFIAENDLSLSFAPKLLEFAQEVSKDPKALNELYFKRTSASYKLVHGVNVVLKKPLCQKVREKSVPQVPASEKKLGTDSLELAPAPKRQM